MSILGNLDCHGKTDLGKVRMVNGDQFLIADLQKSMMVDQTSLDLRDRTRLVGRSQGQLLAVMEGMGDEEQGERASQIAVNTIERFILNRMHWFFRMGDEQGDDLKSELMEALRRCQENFQIVAQEHPEALGMGSTAALAYVSWPLLYVVQVGGSRCYLKRGPTLTRLTAKDVQGVNVDTGGPEDSRKVRDPMDRREPLDPLRGEGPSRPESRHIKLEAGDILLLCTDGLTEGVPDWDIKSLLESGVSAEVSCRRLVEAANGAGGHDNVTVVVARVLDRFPSTVKQQVSHAELPKEEFVP
jgi:serine/threonine protein phosphatase PrpC